MLFGDLLECFNDECTATEAVLSIGDLGLLAALRDEARREGLELGAFAAQSLRRYAEEASDEEWITLMGVLGRASDPGLAFVSRALTRATQGTA